jgi:putative transposase
MSVPRVISTDKLVRDRAAQWGVLPSVQHRPHRHLTNRAENSYRPTRERERRMGRRKSPGHAQHFRVAYGPIASPFPPSGHLFHSDEYRLEKMHRFRIWREITGTTMAA